MSSTSIPTKNEVEEKINTGVSKVKGLIEPTTTSTSASTPASTDVLDLGSIIMFQGFWWTMLLTAVGIVVCLILGAFLCVYRGRLLHSKNKKNKLKNLSSSPSTTTTTRDVTQISLSKIKSHHSVVPSITQIEKLEDYNKSKMSLEEEQEDDILEYPPKVAYNT